MVILFCVLLASAIAIGGLYVLLTPELITPYDETVVIYESTYSEAENISIYYDVCFHSATLKVVDDPGSMIEINDKLEVLVEGGMGKNTSIQVPQSAYGRYVTVQILKEKPVDICAWSICDAQAIVNVTINSAYTIDIEALAGHGHINLTATNASFDTIYFHHGLNCQGNNGFNITNSVIYEDLRCEVSTGNFWVRLDDVTVAGTVECAPPDRGILIQI